MTPRAQRSYITNVFPEIDGGRYKIKRELDSVLSITAEIFGSKNFVAWLKFRKEGDKSWKKVQMEPKSANRYEGGFPLSHLGVYQYTVEAAFAERKSVGLEYGKILEVLVEPVRARYAAWYEMFHRSQGKIQGQSATFKDMEERLEDISRMGFDVIYLPPVHPIGISKRKGPNNSLEVGPSDPGCPWAVGNHHGGHKSINPELGTLEQFAGFVRAANKRGIDIALDIAFNCSPDHPYVKEHPEWFHHRADGSIAFAENPPKKYEDIYPLNFYPEPGREELWDELKDIFLFWAKHGVKTFRVDNPHTKPTEFWEWVIREVKLKFPESIFLAEAFTNYERLELHAKIGFSQSYSYFTWRTGKNELMEYFSKLTNSYLKDFLRVNLFTNTPDICPQMLQTGNRQVFKMRLSLAATLSSVYGIYNGFELCDGDAFPNTEIYRNSEKYQYKVWDWDRPGNIREYISAINRIRRENPALHYYDNLEFCSSTNDWIVSYLKLSPDHDNILLIVVNLDQGSRQTARITVPVEKLGIPSDGEYIMRELITGALYTWKGRENFIAMDPQVEPAYIFRLERQTWT
ncbi:MAG: DUF3416 domain-containing protein [Candidatus Wallbacteria bacterium]|nr:DUF3416 domain-containing protein [Candidatus Wallbacteria bacterium]